MEWDLDGDASLVTAASSGLGLASAKALAAAGSDVAICGRTPSASRRRRPNSRAVGSGRVLAVQADITDQAAVEALVEETVETFDGLDHLVTSAGGPPSTSFLETSAEEWYAAYDQLIMSVVWTIEAAHPALVKSTRGSIVCISSRTVREAAEGLVLSNAVRRGVSGLVQTVSREFGPDIRVNTVLPGTIETSRIEELIEAGIEQGRFDSYEDGLSAMAADIPLGRIGQPEEFGSVVSFLSSPASRYVNGVELPVDGGNLRE
ncbi:MAG: SDR family oxidoreductase [Natrialbaceae archaeon]|nr:SDR family oxidoreductase [Natrialbaceae archaeon]